MRPPPSAPPETWSLALTKTYNIPPKLILLMELEKRIKEKKKDLILLHAGIWQTVKHQGQWPIPNAHLCAWQVHMHLLEAIMQRYTKEY